MPSLVGPWCPGSSAPAWSPAVLSSPPITSLPFFLPVIILGNLVPVTIFAANVLVSLFNSLKKRKKLMLDALLPLRSCCSCLAAGGRHQEERLTPPWIICREKWEDSYYWLGSLTAFSLSLPHAHTHTHTFLPMLSSFSRVVKWSLLHSSNLCCSQAHVK